MGWAHPAGFEPAPVGPPTASSSATSTRRTTAEKGDGGAFAFTDPKDHDQQWDKRTGVSSWVNEWGRYGSCTLFVPAGRHFSLGARGNCNRTYTWFSLGTDTKPIYKSARKA